MYLLAVSDAFVVLGLAAVGTDWIISFLTVTVGLSCYFDEAWALSVTFFVVPARIIRKIVLGKC